MHIGDKIKLLRADNQWTQKELAEKLKCTQSKVSDLEKGTYQIDTVMKVRLSEVFEKPQSYFEEEKPNEIPDATYNKAFIESMLNDLIERGVIKDPDDIDESVLDLIIAAIKIDIKTKLEKQL